MSTWAAFAAKGTAMAATTAAGAGASQAIAPGALDSPQLAPLLTLLRSDRFKASVEELGGYSAKEMGRRVR